MHNIIAFDLDGTLAEIGKPVEYKNIVLLRELECAGYKIAVCSGKPIYYLCGFARQLGLKTPVLIGENGATAQYGVDLPPRRRWSYTCSAETRTQFDRLRRLIDAECGNDIWYQPNDIMLTPFPADTESFEHLSRVVESHRAEMTELNIYRHVDCFDITPKSVDKAVGLKWLAEQESLGAADIIAVGDGVNDIPMFEFADVSVKIVRTEDYPADLCFDSIYEAMSYILEKKI